MIDQSPNRLHLCLRPSTLRGAFYVSCGLFLAVPVAGLACIVGGVLAFAGCILALGLVLMGGMVLAIGGVGMVLFGFAGDRHEFTGGGLLAGICGLAAIGFFQIHNQQALNAAETALSNCWLTAGRLVQHLFFGQWLFLWAWSVVVLAIILAAIVLLLIAVLRSESFFKSRFFGIHYTCPKGHERGTPLFRCPQCSTLIRGLLPSRYGVFAAQCGRCEAKLPTLDWSGRADLQKVCEKCAADLHPATGNARETHLAIVGSESSGKTTLLYASLRQIARNYGPKYGFELDFGSAQGRRMVEGRMQRLASGLRLAKTPSVPRPPALNAAIRSRELDKRLVYLYDAAGEDFVNESRMSGHEFHRYLEGVLLVIDPFAEALSRSHQGASLDRRVWSESQPAVTDAAAVLQPFLNRLEEQMGISAEGVFPIPVAVVLTKTARFPRRMLRSRRECSAGDRRSVCDFMLDLGLANLIAVLESRFHRVAYFSTSAAEEVSTRSKRSRRLKAALPLLWLLVESGTLPRKALRQKPQSKFSRTKWGSRTSLMNCVTIWAGDRDGEPVPAPFSAEELASLGSTAP